ncbi:glycosyltransferase [Variovorax sp.]|uniref:glycosyltransferase n=1 Tax=Variovorax sp. TaxID=1871043 RepID=UPI002D7480BA|nr:glycosyltransferase [Variovorax sp.]HYP85728.1 glycosyltransferase [Variovorax sp.]
MQSNPIDSPPSAASGRGLVINGKFLQPSTSRSGVYRVARELLVALDSVLANNPALAAAMPCRVIIPSAPDPGLRLSHIQIETDELAPGVGQLRRRLRGVLWEQFALPRLARGDTLVSLCNIGPMGYGNAFTLVHDAQVYSSPESYSRAFRSWYQLVLPRLGRRNRSLLTVSDFSRRQLAHFGVADARRIQVIHNGCDHVLRLTPDAGTVESAGLSGKRYVLALANTQPHKNVQVLLKAFQSEALRGVTLALFGPARREDFERQGHAVPPNVAFLGFVSDEELAGLLGQASALAFPSTTEGFGLPPLEAMLLGCPTIAAPCGALPEVCGDAVLWADSQDAAQWQRQILRLCDDDALRQDMQRRGRAHAAQFTWERAARRLLDTVLGEPLAEAAEPAGRAGAAAPVLRDAPQPIHHSGLTAGYPSMQLKIAVAIATAGRRDVLADTIRFLARQTRQADELLICPARPEDLDPACLEGFPCPTRVVSGPIGLPAQRNALIDATQADLVVFFDDDFLPADDFLEEAERLFLGRPEVLVATGQVLADGILGPGLAYEQGVELLANAGRGSQPPSLTPTYNAYGCNMAIRMAPVRQHKYRFDERLPLYAWLEDVDFCRQLAPHGRIVKYTSLRGVHLGTKSGRSPGKRLGYSQVANRIYIMRKGHMSAWQALDGNLRNVTANLLRSLRPEPWVDRRGRLAGNMLALWDWARGRVDPERILRF